MVESEIFASIRSILDRMEAAARRSGRKAAEVTLLAVSKTKPLETVVAAARTGLVTHFGENRVQVWCACGGNGVPIGRRVETETVQYH